MELLCAGAEIEALSCTFSVSESAAAPILKGVVDEAKLVHDAPEKIMVITTEKNVPTTQTGVGITCIGRAADGLRSGLSRPNDLVLGLGIPKVGAEVSLSDPQIVDIPTLKRLINFTGVRDVAPVGSKGMLYEAMAIAEAAELKLDVTNNNHELTKSAGPATAIVFSCAPALLPKLEQAFCHITCIGKLGGLT